MAENTNVNKVVYGNDTLIDLTQDSVSAENLLEGETAHDRSGAPVTGTAKQGHILKNQAGTAMTQRANMLFKDAGLSDNSAGAATEVEIIHQLTKSQLDALGQNTDGIYETTDEEDIPIGDIEEDYVEVVADGVKTYGTLLNELYIASDLSKVGNSTQLLIGVSIYSLIGVASGICYFTQVSMNSQLPAVQEIGIDSSNSYNHRYRQNQFTDLSSTVPTNGTKITLYYGNKVAVIDLQTMANRCITSDGRNVQISLNERLISVEIPFSSFAWDSNNVAFKTSQPINVNPITNVKGFLVRPTNGNAILGAYLNSQGYLYVSGVISKTMTSDISAYIFKCFAIGTQ